MAANRFLAKSRGISEEDIKLIDTIHEVIEEIIKEHLHSETDEESILSAIEQWEYRLQELWNFPLDKSKHTWKNRYLFKKQWAFTTWECVETGESFTIPYGVEETDFYVIGNGYVDVGRFNCYSRMSGVRQID